jgi:hypothetical protein
VTGAEETELIMFVLTPVLYIGHLAGEFELSHESIRSMNISSFRGFSEVIFCRYRY